MACWGGQQDSRTQTGTGRPEDLAVAYGSSTIFFIQSHVHPLFPLASRLRLGYDIAVHSTPLLTTFGRKHEAPGG